MNKDADRRKINAFLPKTAKGAAQIKAAREFISALLVFVLLLGNLISCNKSSAEYPQSQKNYLPDQFVAVKSDRFQSITEQTDTFLSLEILNDEYIETLLDKYHADIGDIFISLISVDDYLKLAKTIDPERKLDTNRIFSNLVIGAFVVLICVAIPSLVPGLAPQVATILLAAPKAALIGAATDAAISGVIGYVRSDGDLKSTFYDAIEGGSEGFKYGAIFNVGAAAFTSVKIARNAQKIQRVNAAARRPATPKNVNFSETGRSVGVGTAINSAGDIALAGMRRENFIAKFGQTLYNDIFNYSLTQFDDIINAMLGLPLNRARGVVNGETYKGAALSKALMERGNRINNFLKTQSISRETTLWQGIRNSPAQIEMRYNVKNLTGKSAEQMANIIKNGGKTSSPELMTSSTLKRNIHVENYSVFGSGKNISANDVSILREFRAPAGTQGFNIDSLCNSRARGIDYFLMPKGLNTQVIDATVETVIRDGKSYKIIHVIEEIIIGGV